MRPKASSVAISLIGAFALTVLAGILPMGFLLSENSGNVEASSRELRLLNQEKGASPQTGVDPLEAAKAYVNDAIAAYREDPEAALAYYRSGGSVVNDPPGLYLTLLDGDVIKVNPLFRGAEGLSISWREDPLGNRYGEKLAAADEDGAVVEYLIPIPTQDYTFRKKTAWAIRAAVPDIDSPGEMENLVFTAGWLDLEGEVESSFTEAQKAIGAVIEARARMQAGVVVPEVGTAAPTLNYYKSTDSIDGEIYVWLALPNGLITADATMPELVGQNIADVYPDVGDDMLAVQPQQARWIAHMWPNPQTKQVELKHSYVTNFIGIYIVSGYYDETSPLTPVARPCITPIDGAGTHSGTWDNSCMSENRPSGEGGQSGADYYSRFYSFTLDEDARVTITLTSDQDEDTYLYVIEGEGKKGTIAAENDDISSSDLNSRIEDHALAAGTYTIEATAYEPETGGNFTLVLEIVDAGPPPPTAVEYIAISSGANHVCAIATDGSIMCWGNEDGDSHGQVSDRPTSGRFTQISSGSNHTCALRDDGAVRCWGSVDVP